MTAYDFEGSVARLEERRTRFSAVDLLAADFPPPRWAVPDLIPEGLTFFAGPPKVGKSWLALNLGISIAAGGRALGKVSVPRGEVLYLGLEDSPRRLQDRLRMMLGDEAPPDGLILETCWPPLKEGGSDEMDAYLRQHPECRAVIVDVFAKVRPLTSDKSDRYLADYLAAEPLKMLADRHRVAMIALHHTRKAASDDFLETVSGTFGLAGAADTILVLKRSRGQADAELHITGRDVEERQLALEFSAHAGTWTLKGEAAEWSISQQQREILDTLKAAAVPLAPKEISEVVSSSHDTVKHLVVKMAEADLIEATGQGTYRTRSLHTPRSLTGEQSEQSEWGTGGVS